MALLSNSAFTTFNADLLSIRISDSVSSSCSDREMMVIFFIDPRGVEIGREKEVIRIHRTRDRDRSSFKKSMIF